MNATLAQHLGNVHVPTHLGQIRTSYQAGRPFAHVVLDELFEPAPLHSAPSLYFLSEITGVWQLLPDPYLQGAGHAVMRRGDFFEVHADRSVAYDTGRVRGLALIAFLNEDWSADFAGNLELWDAEGKACEVAHPNYHGVAAAHLSGGARAIRLSCTSIPRAPRARMPRAHIRRVSRRALIAARSRRCIARRDGSSPLLLDVYRRVRGRSID